MEIHITLTWIFSYSQWQAGKALKATCSPASDTYEDTSLKWLLSLSTPSSYHLYSSPFIEHFNASQCATISIIAQPFEPKVLWGRYFHSHFTDEKPKNQRFHVYIQLLNPYLCQKRVVISSTLQNFLKQQQKYLPKTHSNKYWGLILTDWPQY